MSILFTFPGQGAQRPGLLHALPDDPLVARTLDEAGDALGLDARSLDGAAALESTQAVQLALLIAGVAAARLFEREGGAPDAVAGLSVGAYPAAVVAGVLGFGDALALVRRRGALMAAAFPSGHGMLAILGLREHTLAPLIAQVHRADAPVYLAKLNAPTQLVLAGALDAMARVAALALAAGAIGARPVAIAVPSHCPLLDAAAAELARAFDGVPLAPPRLRYFSAGTARELRDPARIAHDLAHNMAMPVRWHETSVLAAECGMRLAVEMPPGAVLTKLGSAALPGVLCVAADGTRADSVAALMRRERGRGDAAG